MQQFAEKVHDESPIQ